MKRQSAHGTKRRLIWTGLAALALVSGAVFLIRHFESGISAQSWPLPIRIEARGKERKWQFTHSGPDGVLGTDDDVVIAEELRLPVDTEILVELRSEDYIYVFSCPSLGQKEIAVPDLEFSIRFKVSRPGVHDLTMDPMCGFQLPPGQTMGKVRTSSVAEYRSWLNSQSGSRPR